MIPIYIDGHKIEVSKELTILQALNQLNYQTSHFCYQTNLSIAGNCRACLVEVKNAPKPIAACAMPLMPNMEIFTNTPLVKKARENVLEIMLKNHPLDCPICDQGGECDLQDQVMVYGSDKSRTYENRRSVLDKYIGPLVKTVMTRCIHCTRCIRFLNEIAGSSDLGTIKRGESTEISPYIEQTLKTELSGNIIDLCPVGGLTNKTY